jgi:uncharacterized iron-regulated membrane protein
MRSGIEGRVEVVVRTLRKYHRWIAVLLALPLLVIFVTGALLLLRKELAWVEPPEIRGTGGEPTLSLSEILRIAQSVPEARVHGWADIARLDLQPRQGLIKVRTVKRWELQIDAGTGKVLGSYLRRAGFLAALHDGSLFHPKVPSLLYFPMAVLSLILWGTGVLLFLLPYFKRA